MLYSTVFGLYLHVDLENRWFEVLVYMKCGNVELVLFIFDVFLVKI